MSHWNYRVLKLTASTPLGEDESYQIIECYYDDAGRITGWSDAVPTGDDLNELHDSLQRMSTVAGLASLHSKDRRYLTLADLPGTGKRSDGDDA